MKQLIPIAMLLFLAACASDSQKKLLDDIANHYDATTSYSKGFNSSVGNKTQRYFTITVSESKMIDTLRQDVTASNIALMTYEGFTEKEKGAYTQIRVQLLNSTTKDTLVLSYDPDFLKTGEKQENIFNTFSENLMEGNYKAIIEKLEPEYATEEAYNGLSQYMDKLIKEKGKLIAYKRTGFGTVDIDNEKMLRYMAFIKFADGSTINYFINTSSDPENHYLIGYNIK